MIDEPFPIGANVTLKMRDSTETITRYFSFGQYDRENNVDEFGIPDEFIYFYAFEGEKELRERVYDDFTVEAYDLIYHMGSDGTK